METNRGIAINKMGDGLSVRASWYKGGQNIPMSEKDIDAVLSKVVKNLFIVRDLLDNPYA